MKRRIIGVLMAVVVIMGATPSQAQAFEFTPGAFSNGAIADGDLGVCFEDNTPVYTNRAGILVGIRTWSLAKDITFFSNGRCGSDGSNIEVYWGPIGGCNTGARYNAFAGLYVTVSFTFNSNCGVAGFHWDSNAATPNGKWDSATAAMHETGHLLGLDHEDRPDGDGHNGVRDLMDQGAGGCAFGFSSYLSSDDAAGIRARYAGLSNNGANGMFVQFKSPSPCWD